MSFRIRTVLLITAAVCLSRWTAAQAFTVHADQVLCDKWVGFGAQLNGWTYCEPNRQDVNEQNVKDFERKVIELAPQHVRIFALPRWFEKDYDPSARASLVRTCRLAGRAGATVNITYWGGDPGPDLGRRNAEMIEKLIREDHLGGIVRYVTLQNEPNSTRMTLAKYNQIYLSFDETMRKYGLRDQIEIVGGDLLSTHQQKWFDDLTRVLSPILDGYSVHMYSDYWDNKHIVGRFDDLMPIIESIPPEARRPMYITEFGLRGHKKPHEEPGKYEDGRQLMEVPYASMVNGWIMLEAINRGFCAIVQWDMVDLCYDRDLMRYGLIGEPKNGWPLKPGYYLMSMFTHASGAGWKTFKVTGVAENRLVAAMRGPQGQWSIFALNRDKQPLPIHVDGLSPKTTFNIRCWNANGDGHLTDGAPIATDASGHVTFALAPESLLVLTKK